MKRKRVFLGLAVLTLTVAITSLGSWVYGVIQFDADRINYYLEGENDARMDLRKGRLRTKDTPADTLKDRIYKDVLEKSYNIERDRLVGDILPGHFTEYLRGYNAIMDPPTENYLGVENLDRAWQQVNQEFERQTSTEEYAVYAATLREFEPTEEVLVIGTETFDRISNLDPEIKRRTQLAMVVKVFELEHIIEMYNIPPLTPLKPELSQAIEDYEAKNQEPRRLEMISGIRSSCVLLSKDDFEAFFAMPKKGWADYYKKYAESFGWITLSRVGLNREKTEALVYVERHCGSLCADGRFRILSKQMGTWKLENSIPIYAS